MVGFWWICGVWVAGNVGFSKLMSFRGVESRGLMDLLWLLEMFGEDWKDFSSWRRHVAISSLHCLKI